MHSQPYYSPTARTAPSLQFDKLEPLGSSTPNGVGSPRANFQFHKIGEMRPISQKISQNSNKQPGQSNSDIKRSQIDGFSKHGKGFIPSLQQPLSSRYGDLKKSYMGPDEREKAYASMKQLPNENNPKKTVRLFNDFEQPEDEHGKSNEKEANFSKIPSTKLQLASSSQRLDPRDRVLLRKSSLDFTEQWIKPISKKKKWTLNDFEQIKELGSGKYGRVFLARERQTEFICAIKIIQKAMLKEQDITGQFIRELKIQTFLNHPNIIKTYGHFQDQQNIYIIMQVALGGQLYKQLKKQSPMTQTKVATLIKQVVEAVNQLHSNHIIHRDIKPENIVLHQNIVKLCDFGWSVYHGQTLRSTFCGTPLYVSPEILKGNNYDEKIDIWSLGIMMYEMLTGENPFKINQEQELIKIIKDTVTFPAYSNVSNQAKDFVMCCLQKNPNDRKNIRELLNHQFLKKHTDKSPEKKMNI